MSFYKKGMRLQPHPDVPGVGGEVTDADDQRFTVTWDDGDVDADNPQTEAEQPDLREEAKR